ncbi:hypothetical protein [Halobacteriovorax sp. JY17]|uniref:hypothetical protein n=1 Tax=Halobacteriovorax sp. JY17 TaxID=2014617 RepID=UPI000C3ADEA1|nr:hypothetical protein [Halobacteriovorax sp. JY17]PIK15740.1 MAG: hypothetical protein CES88_03150 [Halobacteriovorax sp. JY17]
MKNIFSVSLKSLVLFRISLGVILFFDFLNRFDIIHPFYSDIGIASRSFIMNNEEIPWKMSLLNLNGTPAFANLLATIGLISSLLITLGARTKIASIIAWVLLISFQNRFPIINHGGDNLLRLLLLFSIFAPTNLYLSLDKFFGQSHELEPPEEVSTPFTFLFFIQIFLMYFFTFFYKWNPSWLTKFDSLYFAMSLDIFTTPIGTQLLNFPKLMSIGSFFTLWLEGLGPLFLLIPWKRDYFRMIVIILFWFLHLGILLTMNLGNFPWICLALWLPIVPNSFWTFLSKKNTRALGYTLYFDSNCGFCKRFCILLKNIFFLSKLEVSSSNKDAEINNLIEKNKSWLLVDPKNNQYIEYYVFSKLLDQSFLTKLHFIYANKLSLSLGNYAYQRISKFRFLIGSTLTNLFNIELKVHTNISGIIFATLLISLSISWNFEGYLGSSKFDIKEPFTSIAFALGLNQQWNMFAPKPMRNDAWYIIDGNLQDGTRLNPLTKESISFQKPLHPQNTMKNSQWRKFYLNLSKKSEKKYLRKFANYICREWNNHNENKLTNFKIYYMLERTPDDPKTLLKVNKNLIWTYDCFF